MADQTRKPKPKKEEEAPQASETTTTEEKDEELDDLLDEIDEVLEVNAEDFVRSYVQKGGEAVIPVTLFLDPELPVALSMVFIYLMYRLWKLQHSL